MAEYQPYKVLQPDSQTATQFDWQNLLHHQMPHIYYPGGPPRQPPDWAAIEEAWHMALHFRSELLKHQKVGYQFNLF